MENSEKTAAELRHEKFKALMLEQLRKIPIVQVACERSGVSRASYYRYRKEDPEFAKAADEAIAMGEDYISDMSESQLVALIKEKHFSAILAWLRAHRAKYSAKVEISGSVNVSEELTPEQERAVEESLKLAAPGAPISFPAQNHDNSQAP